MRSPSLTTMQRNVVVARVGEYLVNASPVGIADKQASRLAPDLAEALATLADGRGVDDGQQFFNVVGYEGVEERFIAVLEIAA